MSNLYLTNDKKNLDFSDRDKEYDLEDVNYLKSRLMYLERIIKSKYSDILYLASEICNLKNINLKYDLVDILVKHGSNLSRYKEELVDIKDMLDAFGENKQSQVQERIKEEKNIDNKIDSTENKKPHNFDYESSNSNEKEIVEESNNIEVPNRDVKDFTLESENNKKSSLTKNFKLKNLKIVENSVENAEVEPKEVEEKSKNDISREKILNNLNKLISYKENTFNDLIEMVDFHTDSDSRKAELGKFIECLESQIVELNSYKDNILKNYSLSKSIEIGSNGKITFSRVFIEKERLMDKDKENYIKILGEMHELYTKFVDHYLKNINSMKPYLNPEKINLMQSNCSKVIYDLKIIRNLYSSLEKTKGE